MSTEIKAGEPTFLQKALLAVKHESNDEYAALFGKGAGNMMKALAYCRQLASQGYITYPKNPDDKITLQDKGKAELAKIGQ